MEGRKEGRQVGWLYSVYQTCQTFLIRTFFMFTQKIAVHYNFRCCCCCYCCCHYCYYYYYILRSNAMQCDMYFSDSDSFSDLLPHPKFRCTNVTINIYEVNEKFLKLHFLPVDHPPFTSYYFFTFVSFFNPNISHKMYR